MMSYDYDRSFGERSAAAKDPNIVPVNRLMGRGKAAVAKYLSDATGKEWSAGTFGPKEWFNTVEYRWSSHDQDTNMSWSVEVHIAWNAKAGSYDVRTTGNKGQRSVGFKRQEGLSLDDLKKVENLVPKAVVDDLMQAMGGSYDKELAAIKESASEILEKARAAHRVAEELHALVKDDPIGNAEAIKKRTWELSSLGSSLDHMPKSIDRDIETIKSGR